MGACFFAFCTALFPCRQICFLDKKFLYTRVMKEYFDERSVRFWCVSVGFLWLVLLRGCLCVVARK